MCIKLFIHICSTLLNSPWTSLRLQTKLAAPGFSSAVEPWPSPTSTSSIEPVLLLSLSKSGNQSRLKCNHRNQQTEAHFEHYTFDKVRSLFYGYHL